MRKSIDRPFLIAVVLLVVTGIFIFSSASLGLLARDGAQFSSVAFNQFIAIGVGAVLLICALYTNYRFWRTWALPFFIITLLLTFAVLIPGLGFEFNGARRWLSLGGFSIQPAEFLKVSSVIFFAALMAKAKGNIQEYRHGLLPFFGVLGVCAIALLAQPDTGTFLVISAALFSMFIAAGAPLRDVLITVIVSTLLLALLAFSRPYLMDRIMSFVDPGRDPLGSGYQIQQSLIAVGSGEWLGRGFGQSVQKFNFLPEPIGDSIFSVYAEEFGFFGGLVLLSLFMFFAFRGFRIAARAPDMFGGLLALGIVILITVQSFLNIGSMLGVFPLTGLPLLFVSHGGTAMMMALVEVGIILNISSFQKRTG